EGRPWLEMRISRATRVRTASRITKRLTSNSRASSASGGISSPGRKPSRSIRAMSSFATWSAKVARDTVIVPDPASTVTPNKDPSERTGRWELPEEFHSSRWVADEAISFLRGAADDRSRPFYLVVNFHDPHMPFRAPDPWHAMHDDVELPEPARREGEWQDKPSFYRATIDGCQDELGLQENPEVGIPCQQAQYVGHQGRTAEEEQMWRTYLGMQSLLDHHLGRICDTLDDLGFTDDTLLVYTSDHGDYMGDHWLWSKGPSH